MNSIRNINWQTFEVVNSDVTQAFENMCRILFKQQFLNKNTILNSIPNHPGIEVYPVKQPSTGKKISFQAKYFKSNSSNKYKQIEDSIDKAIKHFSAELDIIYLYCNLELNRKTKTFLRIEESLSIYGIKIELITNHAILDLLSDNPIITHQFFNKNFLEKEWFSRQLKISLDIMEARYNQLFNIETDTETLFNYFLQNEQAVKTIYKKKEEAIKSLEQLTYSLPDYNKFIDRAICKIYDLSIDSSNIKEFLSWKIDLETYFRDDLRILQREIERLNEESSKDRDSLNKVYNLETLLDFSDLLSPTEQERSLILNNVLFLEGEMGTGKTQLLSENSNQLIKQDESVTLLPGQAFLGPDMIEKQIMSFLNLNFDFEEFLYILESIGESNQRYTYIFIDAINESENMKIWKYGLPRLINKVREFENIRLVISIRNGFNEVLYNESIKVKIKNQEISKIEHMGFYNNSIYAIQEFLNQYNISFSPSHYFDFNMTNPLFLTIFCKVHDGSHINFFNLLEKYMEYVDYEAQEKIGLDGSSPLLKLLIDEISQSNLDNNKTSIKKEELLKLNFWELYGLSHQKLQFITVLKRSGILLEFPFENKIYYRFGYNLLEEFIYAMAVVEKFDDPEEGRNYLYFELLDINNGKINNFNKINIFIIASGLFKEKFGEECIDIILDLEDEYIQRDIITKFIESFSLRSSEFVDMNVFKEYAKKAEVDHKVIFKVLIENSIKEDHELNSESLHQILIKQSLQVRDYTWSIYINSLDEQDRLIQLIDYYSVGKRVAENSDKDQINLLVRLFTWLLASSNRMIRDKTSKALIEILKKHTSLGLSLLKNFEEVNDPYITQRLYAVIYGVCMKSQDIKKEEFKELSLYIFDTIFNKDIVYSDILCRDYARQIIERFAYLHPHTLNVNLGEIRPPYKSKPIPSVIDNTNVMDYEGGMRLIASSMAPEDSELLYGDFGRYEFQAALKNFENVDVNHMYKYSLDLIKELGYDNELFTEYDSFLTKREKSRHHHKKIERIGKKYQWIAMFEILAKISDTHSLRYEWGKTLNYNGPWLPYVRDFDPTLNMNKAIPEYAPVLHDYESTEEKFIDEDASQKTIDDWLTVKDELFEKQENELLLKDNEGKEWLVLYQHKEYEKIQNPRCISQSRMRTTQRIWSISHSYFVRAEDFDKLKSELEKAELVGRWFPEGRSSIYELYNREYTWSPAFNDVVNDAWLEYLAETGEYETKSYPSLKFELDENTSEFNSYEEMVSSTVPIKSKVTDVLPTYLHFLWEQQYDASQKEATSFSLPCELIIKELNLKQKEIDGFFYNDKNELVAFDRSLTNSGNGLIIRKEFIEQVLKRNNIRIFWTSIGEKQFIKGDFQGQKYSEWGGFHYFEKGAIKGEMIKY